MSDYLKELKDTVNSALPKETQITKVEMEGPEIAVYTKNPKAFFENENYVAKIAFNLKKRINIRTDKSLLEDERTAKDRILEIIPKEADVREIYFNPCFSEVVIESIKPGLVIGKEGKTSKEIIIQTGWTPRILRSPTSDSKTLKGIRYYLHKHASERKKFLNETAIKIYTNKGKRKDWIRMTALGGYREVGRSSTLIETDQTKVLLDCGINVAMPDETYPYLDILRMPMSELDAVIVSHAHIDHSGMVPYLFKAGYKGPVYCTKPTRELMALLQFDSINLAVQEGKEPPYNETDVKEMVKHCITRDYREVTDIAPDIRLTLHNASHILGSTSVHLHIGEGTHNFVYTGDIKYGFTRLFNNADSNFPRLETLLIESTYGGNHSLMPLHQKAEEMLLKTINETFEKGGNVLIPVFAVGRGQEVMLSIEDFYRKKMIPEAQVFIDGMTKEASAIHTAYPEFLRKQVQRRILQNDSPFSSSLFKEVNAGDREKVLDNSNIIVIASSGMLTGGASLHYFNKMCENENNTLIMVGYMGAGSLGRKLQGGLRTVPVTTNGKTRALNVKMRLETVEGFSGHCSREQLLSYIRSLKPKPKKVIVNHGEKTNTIEFAKTVSSTFNINAVSIADLESVRLN
ncbi:MAG: beta-CASP ribonuclease aCPSF1 [archaeon]